MGAKELMLNIMLAAFLISVCLFWLATFGRAIWWKIREMFD